MIYVTGVHGNEPIPVLTLASLGIKQIVAHPQALAKGVRFLEADLNKSFGTGGKTIEDRIAKNILKQIKPSEVVIDLHTMSASSEPFAIVTDPKMIPLAAKTGLKHVVLMKFNIKSGHALIDKRHGISIETGQHNDPKTQIVIKEILKNLAKGEKHKFTLYEVYGQIEHEGTYHNFRMHKDGFVPVLAGEKAYNFPGLKARIIKYRS